MSYDFMLCDPVTDHVLEFDFTHQIKGGTFAVGGTNLAELNVTYNYCKHYYPHFPDNEGIKWMRGKSGAESIPHLESAISKLGDDVDPDYWKPTEGNAKQALHGLLALAKLRPDGVWRVS